VAELFSASTFIFGWSFFWRWFLLVHLPCVFVLGLQQIAGQDLSDRNVAIIFLSYIAFFVWSAFAHGHTLCRLQDVFSLQQRFAASRFVIGAKMLVVVLFCAVAWLVPGWVLGFVVSFCVGAVLGFLAFESVAIGYMSQAASYAANAVMFVFLFGFLAKKVLVAQLRKEAKEFVLPEQVLFATWRADAPSSNKTMEPTR